MTEPSGGEPQWPTVVETDPRFTPVFVELVADLIVEFGFPFVPDSSLPALREAMVDALARLRRAADHEKIHADATTGR